MGETIHAPQVSALFPKGTSDINLATGILHLQTPRQTLVFLNNSIFRRIPANPEMAEHSRPVLHTGPSHQPEGPVGAIQHLCAASPTVPKICWVDSSLPYKLTFLPPAFFLPGQTVQEKLCKMTHRVLGSKATDDTTTKSATLCLLGHNAAHQQRQAEPQLGLYNARSDQGFSKPNRAAA